MGWRNGLPGLREDDDDQQSNTVGVGNYLQQIIHVAETNKNSQDLITSFSESLNVDTLVKMRQVTLPPVVELTLSILQLRHQPKSTAHTMPRSHSV